MIMSDCNLTSEALSEHILTLFWDLHSHKGLALWELCELLKDVRDDEHTRTKTFSNMVLRACKIMISQGLMLKHCSKYCLRYDQILLKNLRKVQPDSKSALCRACSENQENPDGSSERTGHCNGFLTSNGSHNQQNNATDSLQDICASNISSTNSVTSDQNISPESPSSNCVKSDLLNNNFTDKKDKPKQRNRRSQDLLLNDGMTKYFQSDDNRQRNRKKSGEIEKETGRPKRDEAKKVSVKQKPRVSNGEELVLADLDIGVEINTDISKDQCEGIAGVRQNIHQKKVKAKALSKSYLLRRIQQKKRINNVVRLKRVKIASKSLENVQRDPDQHDEVEKKICPKTLNCESSAAGEGSSTSNCNFSDKDLTKETKTVSSKIKHAGRFVFQKSRLHATVDIKLLTARHILKTARLKYRYVKNRKFSSLNKIQKQKNRNELKIMPDTKNSMAAADNMRETEVKIKCFKPRNRRTQDKFLFDDMTPYFRTTSKRRIPLCRARRGNNKSRPVNAKVCEPLNQPSGHSLRTSGGGNSVKKFVNGVLVVNEKFSSPSHNQPSSKVSLDNTPDQKCVATPNDSAGKINNAEVKRRPGRPKKRKFDEGISNLDAIIDAVAKNTMHLYDEMENLTKRRKVTSSSSTIDMVIDSVVKNAVMSDESDSNDLNEVFEKNSPLKKSVDQKLKSFAKLNNFVQKTPENNFGKIRKKSSLQKKCGEQISEVDQGENDADISENDESAEIMNSASSSASPQKLVLSSPQSDTSMESILFPHITDEDVRWFYMAQAIARHRRLQNTNSSEIRPGNDEARKTQLLTSDYKKASYERGTGRIRVPQSVPAELLYIPEIYKLPVCKVEKEEIKPKSRLTTPKMQKMSVGKFSMESGVEDESPSSGSLSHGSSSHDTLSCDTLNRGSPSCDSPSCDSLDRDSPSYDLLSRDSPSLDSLSQDTRSSVESFSDEDYYENEEEETLDSPVHKSQTFVHLSENSNLDAKRERLTCRTEIISQHNQHESAENRNSKIGETQKHVDVENVKKLSSTYGRTENLQRVSAVNEKSLGKEREKSSWFSSSRVEPVPQPLNERIRITTKAKISSVEHSTEMEVRCHKSVEPRPVFTFGRNLLEMSMESEKETKVSNSGESISKSCAMFMGKSVTSTNSWSGFGGIAGQATGLFQEPRRLSDSFSKPLWKNTTFKNCDSGSKLFHSPATISSASNSNNRRYGDILRKPVLNILPGLYAGNNEEKKDCNKFWFGKPLNTESWSKDSEKISHYGGDSFLGYRSSVVNTSSSDSISCENKRETSETFSSGDKCSTNGDSSVSDTLNSAENGIMRDCDRGRNSSEGRLKSDSSRSDCNQMGTEKSSTSQLLNGTESINSVTSLIVEPEKLCSTKQPLSSENLFLSKDVNCGRLFNLEEQLQGNKKNTDFSLKETIPNHTKFASNAVSLESSHGLNVSASKGASTQNSVATIISSETSTLPVFTLANPQNLGSGTTCEANLTQNLLNSMIYSSPIVHPVANQQASTHPLPNQHSAMHLLANQHLAMYPIANQLLAAHPSANQISATHALTNEQSAPHIVANLHSSTQTLANEQSAPHAVANQLSANHAVANEHSLFHPMPYPHLTMHPGVNQHLINQPTPYSHLMANELAPHTLLNNHQPHVLGLSNQPTIAQPFVNQQALSYLLNNQQTPFNPQFLPYALANYKWLSQLMFNSVGNQHLMPTPSNNQLPATQLMTSNQESVDNCSVNQNPATNAAFSSLSVQNLVGEHYSSANPIANQLSVSQFLANEMCSAANAVNSLVASDQSILSDELSVHQIASNQLNSSTSVFPQVVHNPDIIQASISHLISNTAPSEVSLQQLISNPATSEQLIQQLASNNYYPLENPALNKELRCKIAENFDLRSVAPINFDSSMSIMSVNRDLRSAILTNQELKSTANQELNCVISSNHEIGSVMSANHELKSVMPTNDELLSLISTNSHLRALTSASHELNYINVMPTCHASRSATPASMELNSTILANSELELMSQASPKLDVTLPPNLEITSADNFSALEASFNTPNSPESSLLNITSGTNPATSLLEQPSEAQMVISCLASSTAATTPPSSDSLESVTESSSVGKVPSLHVRLPLFHNNLKKEEPSIMYSALSNLDSTSNTSF